MLKYSQIFFELILMLFFFSILSYRVLILDYSGNLAAKDSKVHLIVILLIFNHFNLPSHDAKLVSLSNLS